MFFYTTGDLLQSDAEALVNTVKMCIRDRADTVHLRGKVVHCHNLKAEQPLSLIHICDVLTTEYAKKIGADWYAKDAKQSADIAKEFFCLLYTSRCV